MKLFNIKKIGALTAIGTAISTYSFAANDHITRSLADWVSLCAEILSFICLAVFILYAGRLLKNNKNQTSGQADAEAAKINTGVKNGIMTALVGIALCQAVIIIAQALFV